MKARYLKKLLNDTKYIVCKNGDFICIGSSMVHNILSVNMRMKMKPEVKYAIDTFKEGKAAVTNQELVWIWDKLEELIESGEIHEIWNNDDEVENPKPVYAVKDGELIERFTDEYGWPNVTLDGELMYDNVYFRDKLGALDNGVTSCECHANYLKEEIGRLEENIESRKKALAVTVDELENLKSVVDSLSEKC